VGGREEGLAMDVCCGCHVVYLCLCVNWEYESNIANINKLARSSEKRAQRELVARMSHT
jgi:hypothetical protein